MCSTSHGKIYVPPDVADKIKGDVIRNVCVKEIKTTLEELALRAAVTPSNKYNELQTIVWKQI
jgi:hypothetical protein